MLHKTYTEAQIIEAFSYRNSMTVIQTFVFPNGEAYPICPHCQATLEREYMNHCDRCGQKLSWKKYGNSTIINKI